MLALLICCSTVYHPHKCAVIRWVSLFSGLVYDEPVSLTGQPIIGDNTSEDSLLEDSLLEDSLLENSPSEDIPSEDSLLEDSLLENSCLALDCCVG